MVVFGSADAIVIEWGPETCPSRLTRLMYIPLQNGGSRGNSHLDGGLNLSLRQPGSKNRHQLHSSKCMPQQVESARVTMLDCITKEDVGSKLRVAGR